MIFDRILLIDKKETPNVATRGLNTTRIYTAYHGQAVGTSIYYASQKKAPGFVSSGAAGH